MWVSCYNFALSEIVANRRAVWLLISPVSRHSSHIPGWYCDQSAFWPRASRTFSVKFCKLTNTVSVGHWGCALDPAGEVTAQ